MKMSKVTEKDTATQSLSYRVLSEQLSLISQQIKVILAIVLVLSFLTSFTLWSIIPHKILLIWLALVNFPSLMRIILLYIQRFKDIELNLLGVFNVLLAGWSGVAWGAAGYFFPVIW